MVAVAYVSPYFRQVRTSLIALAGATSSAHLIRKFPKILAASSSASASAAKVFIKFIVYLAAAANATAASIYKQYAISYESASEFLSEFVASIAYAARTAAIASINRVSSIFGPGRVIEYVRGTSTDTTKSDRDSQLYMFGGISTVEHKDRKSLVIKYRTTVVPNAQTDATGSVGVRVSVDQAIERLSVRSATRTSVEEPKERGN